MEEEDARRALCDDHLYDVVDFISQDPAWRSRLFNAPVGKRIEVDEATLSCVFGERGCVLLDSGLKFVAFSEGYTEDWACIFGFESIEFPEIVAYSTNFIREWDGV